MLNFAGSLFFFVLLGGVTARTIAAQQSPNSHPTNLYERRSALKVSPQRSPAARYSPLAEAGGYRRTQTTWYEAALHSLNPRNIDWGKRWEQRRAIFLADTVHNPYFVFCAAMLFCFYASLVAIGWILRDHKKDIRYFETELLKARSWASYWKKHATEAIARHNDHIEKCNRQIEAGPSNVSAAVAPDAPDTKQEIEGLRDKIAKLESERNLLQGNLNAKKKAAQYLASRVEELANAIGGLNGNGPSEQTDERVAAFARRIKNLEELLAAATEENHRLKGD